MVNTLTLTPEELREITGRLQPAAQLRWLGERKWTFEIGRDGLPKVARAYFERRMVMGEGRAGDSSESAAEPSWQVNVEAIRNGAGHSISNR